MKQITLSELPDCVLCLMIGGIIERAIYYAPTKFGWRRMLCEQHFGEYGTSTKESKETIRLVVGTLGEK